MPNKYWVQISSGRGPLECSFVVKKILDILVQEIEEQNLSYDILSSNPNKNNTLKSVLLSIKGDNLNTFLDNWTGSILWIGQSPFRPRHKRKNWFVDIKVFQEPEQFHWSESELIIETMKSSGPGGQHVNTTDSAVRIKHKQTGLSVSASEERSQLMNKKLALSRLENLFKEKNQLKKEEKLNSVWTQHNHLERGNAKRVYKGPGFNRLI